MCDMEQSSDDKCSPYKWQMTELLQFLELYKEAECLWNTRIVDYTNKTRREECLEVIKSNLAQIGTHVTVQDIRNKIKGVRTTYREELNKIRRSSKLQNKYKPKLFWFNLVDSFLKGVTHNKGSIKSKGKITADSASIKRYKIDNCLGNLTYVQSLQSDTSHEQLNHILNGISRLEKISTQVTETENEYDLFGRSVAIHLKKLPEHTGLELMQKIQYLITDARILYSQSDGLSGITAEQEFDNSPGEVLIVGPH